MLLAGLLNIIPNMRLERERPKDIIRSPDFEIIGTGSIGEKARQLAEKTPTLKRLGFNVPRRTVLAEGFFDGFFQKNHLGENSREARKFTDTETQIQNGDFPIEDCNAIQRVLDSYSSNVPLVIRSSAEGDARGTGTYKSIFTENKAKAVNKALKQVLASYYSKDAAAFRRDSHTTEGFGIIIEPVIGQEISKGDKKVFAPLLSGHGYTSTSREECYINVVSGIGSGVETRGFEKLTKQMLEPYNGELGKYMTENLRSILEGDQKKNFIMTNTAGNHKMHVFFPSEKKPEDKEGSDDKKLFFIDEALRQVNLNPIFDRMQRMEKAFSKPQYFEWALTMEKGQQKDWILQIADFDKKLGMFDFGKYGEPLIEANTVTGSGEIESNTLVHCSNPDKIDSLRNFNEKNKEYILFYDSNIISREKADKFRVQNLFYSDINNASVIIEVNTTPHDIAQLAHFRGQLDMTGKLVGAVQLKPGDKESRGKWDDFWGLKDDESGMKVINKKVKVVASERQNRLALYAQKKI